MPRADPFTLGVASGDPLPRAVVLWTRLAPELFDPMGGMPYQNNFLVQRANDFLTRATRSWS